MAEIWNLISNILHSSLGITAVMGYGIVCSLVKLKAVLYIFSDVLARSKDVGSWI